MHSPFFVGRRLVREPTGEITWYGRVISSGILLHRLIVTTALNGIVKVTPRIHRIVLSGDFKSRDVQDRLGNQRPMNEVDMLIRGQDQPIV